jgi:hypothetical protein
MKMTDAEYVDAVSKINPFVSFNPLPDENGVSTQPDAATPNLVGGTVEVKTITILMNNGEVIDIKGYYRDVYVEENIHSSSIQGKITIVDTEGGLEKFAIHGGEVLRLKICRPDSNDIIIWREDLVIHKITKHDVEPTNFMSMYDLVFTSRSYVNSSKKNLFKSYKGLPLAEAVYSIYKEMSQNDIIMENPNITLAEPFISTGVPPHKAIDYLAQRSCSKDKYFVFFERFIPIYGTFADGKSFTTTHYFGSIEKLIKDAEIFEPKTIFFVPKVDANFEGRAIRGINYKRLENHNHLAGMAYGFYNSTISSINPIKQNYNFQKISYANNEDETNDFYSNKLLNSTNIFNIYNDIQNETPGRKLIFSKLNDTVGRETWLRNHIYGALSKSMFKISIDVQGGTNGIGIGHVVNFVTPSQVSMMLNPQAAVPEVDPIYSGKYLVTSVFHTITSTQYTKTLHLARGSTPFNYDSNTSLESSLDELRSELLTLYGNKRISE